MGSAVGCLCSLNSSGLPVGVCVHSILATEDPGQGGSRGDARGVSQAAPGSRGTEPRLRGSVDQRGACRAQGGSGRSADEDEEGLNRDESKEGLYKPDQEDSPMEFGGACDEEVDDSGIPELTEEILAKLF